MALILVVMKKKYISLLIVLLSWALTSAQTKIYTITIDREIDKAASRILSMGVEEAVEKNADYILIRIDTYGGAVDVADSMRRVLMKAPITTIAFIDNQAVSAGALISLACDSIYMSSGATFGAASVVNQNGEVMPEKYQAFMRAMMRSTAESQNRNPLIAEAMVGSDTTLGGIVDSSKVLSFTREEAILNNYCEGRAESINDVAQIISRNSLYSFEHQRITTLDKIISIFLTPVIQGILIMLIIGGIYFEFQSPGIGFPIAVSVVAALLYFSPLYLEGLAEYWEILVFIAGLILIGLEIFLTPGIGIFGILGGVLFITALTFAMIDNRILYFNDKISILPIIKPLSIVLLSAFLSSMIAIFTAGKVFKKNSIFKLALSNELKESDGFVGVDTQFGEIIGKEAIVISDLRPSGKIEVNGKWFEASIENGYAKKGTKVKITRSESGRLYCEGLD